VKEKKYFLSMLETIWIFGFEANLIAIDTACRAVNRNCV